MDDLDDLRISDLQALLRARGLGTNYRLKVDLVNRLRTNRLQSTSDSTESIIINDSVSDDENVFNDTNNTEGENNSSSNNDGDQNNGNGEQNNEDDNNDKGNTDTTNENQNNSEDNELNMASISFRDVEDGLPRFHGLTHENAQRWVTNFEKIATAQKWNENQQYVFMRKLLKGAAKKDVDGEDDLITYETLKNYLIEEYKEETSVRELHKLLENKRKTNKETCLEYMFDMIKLGQKKLDDKSMIAYIVDGINTSKDSKMVLYDASTLKDLKQKMRTFESIHTNVLNQENDKNDKKRSSTKTYGKTNGRTEQSGGNEGKNFSTMKTKNCFNCGDKTHILDDCPNKSKGRKCFNCEAFGHISKDCRIPKKEKKEAFIVETTTTTEKQRMRFPAIINKKLVIAVLDTGSDYTLMRKSAYQKTGLGKLEDAYISLKGFSPRGESSKQCIQTTIHIEDEDYVLKIYIVNDNLIPEDVLLGRDFLKLTDITITGGFPVIQKLHNDEQCVATNVPEIFTIETTILTEGKDTLKCVEDIQDPQYRNIVAKMIDDYKPKRVEKSHIQMVILLKDQIPVHQNPRRLAQVERQAVTDIITDWLEKGIIRHSRSEYASPILLRKKKNGLYRLCVDYRKLNEKVIKDRYPLPIMEDVINAVRNYFVFSSIDLVNGFFHVDIEESSRKYTAFVTPDGHYEFTKAPFGFCNSPAIFQRYVNNVFHDAQYAGKVTLYLDDATIPGIDEEDNLKKLREVFKIAADNGLLINFNKCQFLQREINFLGFIIKNQTVRPSNEKTLAIERFPIPTNEKQLQSFLGLTGFFRKFVYNYAIIARPLSMLLQKEQTFRFGNEQMEAYETLKRKLCEEPVLKIYNPQAETQLHCDASALGFGGCLLQRQDDDDNQFHPVYFLSFKTTPAEAKLHSYVLEVLAIMRCLERLRSYVLGIKLTIFTDCHAFEQTMAKKTATARIARWALALEEYDVEVKHRSGTRMKHVDALSRNFILSVEDGLLPQIRKEQLEDEECNMISALLDKGPYKQYMKKSGLIYRFHDGIYTLKIPKRMVNPVLLQLHGDTHVGKRRMEVMVQQQYDITGAHKEIDRIVSNCITCILATKKKGKQEGFLSPIDKQEVPLDTYHIDHIGPMATTNKGYTQILVVIDAFTKFCWFYPVKSTGVDEAISRLQGQEDIFGNPRRLIADKGSAFRANDFATYCKDRNIHLHLVTTATPRGNGQVERVNGTLIPILTKMAITQPKQWFKYVGKLQRCINSSVSRSTGKTPFELMIGVKMKDEKDLDLNKVIEEEIINEFNCHRDELRVLAKTNILKLQEENVKQYNKKRKEPHMYVLGDVVAIQRMQKEKGQKFYTKMIGPYEVIKVKRNHRYDVQKIGTGEGPINTSTSADRMKPWADTAENDDSD